MTPPPIKKTLEGVLTDTRERLDLVERRLAKGTGGSGSDLEPTYDSGWVEAKTTVVWATGWSISGSTPSVKFRRVGAVVQMVVLYAMVAPGTFSIPVHGNVGNSDVFSGIPAEFRPAPGTQGAATTGNTGPTATFTISDAGTLQLAAMTPDATQTGSVSNLVNYFTIVGTWLADGSKPLGPAAQVDVPAGVLAGLVMAWDSNTIPSGWLLCDGSLVGRATYPELFAVVGTTHGAGDGSTTFALPNYKGRALVGRDPADTAFDVLGESGGSNVHSHLTGQGYDGGNIFSMAANTALPDGRVLGSSVLNVDRAVTAVGHSVAAARLAWTFEDGTHDPYVVVNYIISTGSGVGGGGSSVPALPDPRVVRASTLTVTAAAGAWQDFPGSSTVVLDLPYPMWVRADFSAQVGQTAAEYGMIGVSATGALNLIPETGQDGATGAFGEGTAYAAVGSTANHVRLYGSKTFLLPAGQTTLKIQARRSGTAVSPILSYPTLQVTSLYWAGAPGPVQDVAVTGRATTTVNATTPATASTDFVVSNWNTFEGPAGMWSSASPSRFVLNKAGKWRVTGKIRMNGATSGIGYMKISKNGATIGQTEDLRVIGNAGSYPQVNDIITSNGTDYVEFVATNSNVSQQVVWNNQLATFEWIGA